MEWSQRRTADALIGTPAGRVDETSWEAFQQALQGAIADAAGSGTAMVIDLEQLDYMSSRGLRVLTLVKREADSAGIGLSLARPNARMREILAISRYDRIFAVTDAIAD